MRQIILRCTRTIFYFSFFNILYSRKPLAAMQLASCYIAVGREEEAFAQIGRVPSLIVNNSNRFAKIAKAKAERIYKRHKAPFLAFDFLYLRRDMAHQGIFAWFRIFQPWLNRPRHRKPSAIAQNPRESGACNTGRRGVARPVCALVRSQSQVSQPP